MEDEQMKICARVVTEIFSRIELRPDKINEFKEKLEDLCNEYDRID